MKVRVLIQRAISIFVLSLGVWVTLAYPCPRARDSRFCVPLLSVLQREAADRAAAVGEGSAAHSEKVKSLN